MERCNLSARAVALVYRGWSRYARLAHPRARREATPRRPLRLAGLARLTRHAGPSRLKLGRSAATVSREIARNGSSSGYDAVTAERGYRRRRSRGRRKLAPSAPLWNPVVMDLYRGGSPEQIAGRRRTMYPDEPAQWVSHETIYRALYARPRGELRKALLAQLRQGHAARRPRSRGQDLRSGLKHMTSMHDRPAEVAGREVPGHWEGDLIKGAGHRSAVGPLVPFVMLARMDGTDAEPALAVFPRKLRRIPPCVRKTLTYDQGKEMARHAELARRLRIRVYFADPHRPWQRPSNENANGSIRGSTCPKAGTSPKSQSLRRS